MTIRGNTPALNLHNISSGYRQRRILNKLNLQLNSESVTSLIGSNGCGKSTLLKTMCGLLPYQGTVELGGKNLTQYGRKERAGIISMLPQAPIAPEGLTVMQLISRGRHPHQNWANRWSTEDEAVVAHALEVTGLTNLSNRPIGELSGGQRQRVWIALTLAQETPVMLLDEPTTYLDLSRSIEVLSLVRTLQRERNTTVVMVLHDLNLAARYSDELVALAPDGTIAAQGAPEEVLTPSLLREVFDLDAVVIPDPTADGPLVVPRC